ncbi:MAG: histidine kinase N-terminal 7TM domain-containing protein, partial [Candidatus Omnitrophota bacterium]
MGLTALGSYLLGLFVLSRNHRHSLYSSWFYFCCSVGTWSLGYFFTMLPNVPKDIALLCSRVSHASGALIPAFFLRYIFILLDIKKKKLLLACYIPSVILAILSLTSFVVIDLVPKLFFKYYPAGKFGYVLYVINFIYWVIVAHYFMIKNYRVISGYKRNQMRYLLFGTILGYFGGATCFPLVFNMQIPPYPTVLILVYVFTTTIAILRYRLMDITVAITRTGVFVAVYTLILGLPFAV